MIIDTENLSAVPELEPRSCEGCVFALGNVGGDSAFCNGQTCGARGIIYAERPPKDVTKKQKKTIALIPAIEPDSCKGCIFANGHKCVKPRHIKLACWQTDAIFIRRFCM